MPVTAMPRFASGIAARPVPTASSRARRLSAGQPFQEFHRSGICVGVEPVVVARPLVAVYPLQVGRRGLVLHVNNLVVGSDGILRMQAPAPAPILPRP